MLLKSALAKGKLLETYIADRIREKGIDAHASRSSGSGNGNREKADIVTSATIFGRNLGIECKNQKNLAIPLWWRQTKKLEQFGREPVLAFKMDREPFEETKVVIYANTFLDLVKRAQSPVEVSEPNRQLSWDLKNLQVYTKKVLKHLEE